MLLSVTPGSEDTICGIVIQNTLAAAAAAEVYSAPPTLP